MITQKETLGYTSYPIFETLSWAITYHCGSQDNDKFHHNGGAYISDILDVDCEGPTLEKAEKMTFPVVETFTLDEIVYYRIKVGEGLYWTSEND